MRRAITFVSLVLVAGLLQIGGADATPPVKFLPGVYANLVRRLEARQR